ncbi:MAG: hypothetical protein HYS13_07320 [Planctomycetia bacterium]|nr:hypothetical protein [Planctomycetia bacterium]
MSSDASQEREQRQTTLREVLALLLLWAVGFGLLRTLPIVPGALLLAVLAVAVQLWLVCAKAPRLIMHLALWSALLMYYFAILRSR